MKLWGDEAPENSTQPRESWAIPLFTGAAVLLWVGAILWLIDSVTYVAKP